MSSKTTSTSSSPTHIASGTRQLRYTALTQLRGYIAQLHDGSHRLSARLVGKDGQEIRKLHLDRIEIKTLAADRLQIVVDGTQREVQLYQKNQQLYVFDREGNNFLVTNTYDQVQKSKSELVDKEYIKSQMPGIVVRLAVKAGDQVKKGDVVAFLEAMKMEHKILAPEDSVIGEVYVKEKGFVEAGQPLFKLKQLAA
jgi:biotin carboxyl carrier protein